jgi:hypothetical protein
MQTLLITDQRVDRQIDGKFAPGSKIHEMSDRGRGWAKPSVRLAHIMNSKTVAELKKATADIELDKLTGMEAMAHTRALAAVYGDRQDAEMVIDRLEGKAPQTMKQEITGKDGGPVAVVTADVTNLLMELSNKIIE